MNKVLFIISLFLTITITSIANAAEKLPIQFMGVTKNSSCDPNKYLDLDSSISDIKKKYSKKFNFKPDKDFDDQILCTIILNTVDTTKQIIAGSYKYYFRVGATIVFAERMEDESLSLLYARNALFNQPVVNCNKLSKKEIKHYFRDTFNKCISELFNKSSEMYSPSKGNAKITNISEGVAIINAGYRDGVGKFSPINSASGGERIGRVIEVKSRSTKIKLTKTLHKGDNVKYIFNSKIIADSDYVFQVNKIKVSDEILKYYLGSKVHSNDVDTAAALSFAQWLNDGLVQQGKINMYPPRLVLNPKMLTEFGMYIGLNQKALDSFIDSVELKNPDQIDNIIDFQINAQIAKAGTKVLKESKVGKNTAYLCLSYAGIVSIDNPKKVLLTEKMVGSATHKEISSKQIHNFLPKDFYRQAFHASLVKLGVKFGKKIESDLNTKNSVLRAGAI